MFTLALRARAVGVWVGEKSAVNIGEGAGGLWGFISSIRGVSGGLGGLFLPPTPTLLCRGVD